MRDEITGMTAVLETSSSELDAVLEELQAAAPRWSHLGASEKAELLLEVRGTVHAMARTWAEAGAGAKGIAQSPLAGEEWVAGPWATLYAINRYVATLREIARSGSPEIPASRVRQRADGQTVVNVFPGGLWDRLLLSGIEADVWMQPGVTPATLASTMGIWYKETSHEARVCLVLGAGNIAAIPPLDVLYKLVAEGSVCLLKMNPVNAYLTPIFRTALAPLIREGFLRIVDGGAPTGAYLTNHASVDEIHITGSDRTHDAIIWGTDGQAAERKSRKAPLLAKSITSELGNVSPTIVLPGTWSDADYEFQAQQIVTQKLHNDGFNCIALQVLVLPKAWDGTPKLLAAIDATMKCVPPRP
ncbi:MAG: aldehyde dehydrogenase family protein, partial [Vulcanimicrobiaceae bacterium]